MRDGEHKESIKKQSYKLLDMIEKDRQRTVKDRLIVALVNIARKSDHIKLCHVRDELREEGIADFFSDDALLKHFNRAIERIDLIIK